MTEEKQEYHVNRAEFRGKILEAKYGKTEKDISFCNLLIEVPGKKFTEIIPCMTYGEYNVPPVGSKVIIFARLRSKLSQDKYFLSVLVESIDILK